MPHIHPALTIVSTIGLLPAPRVHAPLRPRPSSVCASLPPPPPPQHVFDVETATLLAGFAFEAYNEPEEGDARWERGADGCNVAFMSDGFAAECYAGRLEVTLHEVRDLPPPKQLNLNLNDPASLLSGGNVDPYVVFALNEETAKGPKEGAVGLQRATDLARTATRWASEAKRGTARGAAEWPDGGEEIYLYVKKVEEAQLALTAFDEDVLKEDEALGAASVRLSSLLSPDPGGGGSWSGWIPLTWRPAETKDNAVLAGSVAGAFIAGPVGAAAGGVLANTFLKKEAQGEVRVSLRYVELEAPPVEAPPPPPPPSPMTAAAPPALASRTAAATPERAQLLQAELEKLRERMRAEATAEAEGEAEAEAEGAGAGFRLRAAPRGASEGLDWTELRSRVMEEEGEGGTYELCCYVDHEPTSTQVAMWRDKRRRRIVLSFRGTSDVMDVLTDVNLLQTPLEQRADGGRSDDERVVHAGFFASARAVNRRLKELLVAACVGTPGDWEVLVTGHSLGGALATLFAPEVARGVDASRGFKERADEPWFSSLVELVAGKAAELTGDVPVRLRRVRLYTFGAPRVGNSAFAADFDALGMECFRVVNGADIVARMPRHANSAGAVLDYEHVGRTVLIDEAGEVADGFWVEGESADAVCPLRDVSPLTNPFGPNSVLSDVAARVAAVGAAAQGGGDGAEASGEEGEGGGGDLAGQVKGLARSLGATAAELGRAKDDIFARVEKMTTAEAMSMIGLDARFVESEVRTLDSIRRGTFLLHHLEPSYFAAMRRAIDRHLEAEWSEELGRGVWGPPGRGLAGRDAQGQEDTRG